MCVARPQLVKYKETIIPLDVSEKKIQLLGPNDDVICHNTHIIGSDKMLSLPLPEPKFDYHKAGHVAFTKWHWD